MEVYDQVVSDDDRFVDCSGQHVGDGEQNCNDGVIKRMMMVMALCHKHFVVIL